MASNLQNVLADALPKDVQFTFHYIASRPTKCDALYAAPPGQSPEPTWRESHFVTVSIHPDPSASARTVHNRGNAVFVFAFELIVYITANLTTIFVSKADSTGYLSLLSTPQSRRASGGSPIKIIARAFVLWLAQEERRKRPGIRLNVCLFARAQDQYLFPESIENGKKHVLDDRGLVRWWCSVLDPILDRVQDVDSTSQSSSQGDSFVSSPRAYLIVPGLDKYETVRFTPHASSSTSTNTSSKPTRWCHGHPLLTLSGYPAAPPRCLVPRFPDDPKARFVMELDEELPDASSQTLDSSQASTSPSKRASNGQWRSVRSLDQFWDLMSFRQECSSGRLVGFIWLVFEPVPGGSRGDLPSASHARDKSPSRSSPRGNHRLTGPIRVRIRSRSSRAKNIQSTGKISETANLPPRLTVSDRDYHRATENLLTLSFSNEEATRLSSERWVREVGSMARSGDREWTWSVKGLYQPPAPSGQINGDGVSSASGVNVLNGTMVRKRKKEGSSQENQSKDGEQVSKPAGSAGVNVLGAGLVRKKAKS